MVTSSRVIARSTGPVYPRSSNPVRPPERDFGTELAQAAPGTPDAKALLFHAVQGRTGWPREVISRYGGQPVSYTDRTLTCVDCSVEFIHSAADQEFYAEKGFVSDPKRCPSCRAARRSMRDSSGYDSRDIGGPRGYERGDYRAPREYFAVICSECGNAAQVPFKPRMDKPVYCSDCFRTVQANTTEGSGTA